ncbi:MAG: SAM-dependent DNA methyltransferase [Nitrospirae bacterium]|nr:SAM-dependent DNA methyltransferase [Nitrospirota bacterium]
MSVHNQTKTLGQFFTPPDVARTLVHWATQRKRDRLLDPSCGDGEFLACHRKSVGIEIDPQKAAMAKMRAPWSLVHEGDFFDWAAQTKERFDAAAGNPPFIRYQSFSGVLREKALSLASFLGAEFSGLSSSWAPFLVVAASLLKPGGKMAFVVPAEIGHATYAKPLIEWICGHFGQVRLVAFREKLFPALSEDAWFLYCSGFGDETTGIHLNCLERFVADQEPARFARRIELSTWRESGWKLRRNLLTDTQLDLYDDLIARPSVVRFSEVAHAGIGYVTGANDFFHLRPSEARSHGIPRRVLRVSVRKSQQLPSSTVDRAVVANWIATDEPVLLLDLAELNDLPDSVRRYLATPAARDAKRAYKCRNRAPWYAVPDVRTPDAFLSYMSDSQPLLVRNPAGCTCTNSIHAVRFKPGVAARDVQRAWNEPLGQLSCELEGHPLGGGLLKLEPGEAANVRIAMNGLRLTRSEADTIAEATSLMRKWRHYAS